MPHETLDKPVQLLPVPYMSQLGAGADAYHNDCGAASGAMLIKAYTGDIMTPDDFYRATGQESDAYLSANQLATVLTTKGIATEWRENMTLVDLFETLAGGRPPIVLFNYGALREKVGDLENTTFAGGHFAVTVGIDTQNVYLHDPLWSVEEEDSGGAALAIPHVDWMYIWRESKRDLNPECAALVPSMGIGAFAGVTELYRARVISQNGVRVRNAPRVALGTDTGERLAYNYVAKIWAEATDNENNLWGAITVGKRKWIAMTYGEVQLAERIE